MDTKRQLGLRQKQVRVPRRGNKEKIGQDSQFRVPTTVSFPLTIIGFPDRMITTLKYSENYTLSGSTAPAAVYWKVNSAFDPNGSGVGHQPSFYDTFQSIYQRYFVKEFKLEVLISNHSTVPGFIAFGYSDTQISTLTVEQLIEAKYFKSDVLANLNAGGSSIRIELPWMTSHQLMGQPYTEADDQMYAQVTADPGDLAFGILKVAADDGTSTINCNARVILHQRIVFKDLLNTVSS